MKYFSKLILGLIAILTLLSGLVVLFIRRITLQPAAVQAEIVKERLSPNNSLNKDPAQILKPAQNLKIMSYNVQYMAGKNNFFFYDGGPDERPSTDEITKSFHEVARIIQEEDPDIILLQEVSDGAKATDYEDQLTRLLTLLPASYRYHTSAFYWQSLFVPHPKIRGSVGMKLSIISKYYINLAMRHQLPLTPTNWLYQQFNFKRAVLEARLPVVGGNDLLIFNTHLDAFTMGTSILKEQVDFINKLLAQRTQTGYEWIIGGDFNLIPPNQYTHIIEPAQAYFKEKTEILPLYQNYQAAIPDMSTFNKTLVKPWFTFFPNDPRYPEPVVTLDHVFFSEKLEITNRYVRQHDTMTVSDHLPLLVECIIP